jgi:hypothetical protein
MSRIMTVRTLGPRVLLAALATVLLVTVSSCGAAGVTRARVEAAIGPTFANLYALQRAQLGFPKVSGDKIPSKATCDKGGAAEPDEGPGNTWICTIVWQVAGPGTSATAVYNLHIQTTGCYSADGDSPPAINGQQMLDSFDGKQFLNPLWEFEGCFDNN